jgi:hypothetical protein
MFQKIFICDRKKCSIISKERRMEHAFCEEYFIRYSCLVSLIELDGRGKPTGIKKAYTGIGG